MRGNIFVREPIKGKNDNFNLNISSADAARIVMFDEKRGAAGNELHV